MKSQERRTHASRIYLPPPKWPVADDDDKDCKMKLLRCAVAQAAGTLWDLPKPSGEWLEYTVVSNPRTKTLSWLGFKEPIFPKN
jgi:hypothetical protein